MIIKNGLVFNEEGRFEEKDVFIDGDRISTEATGEVIDAKGLYVIPGLTDIHFHACVGYDFCDGTQEAISKMARYELENGITTICPASMTFSEENAWADFSKQLRNMTERTEQSLLALIWRDLYSMEKKEPKILNSFTNLMLKCFIDYRKSRRVN